MTEPGDHAAPDHVADSFVAFIAARSPSAAQACLDAHPELLATTSDQVIGELVKAARDRGVAAAVDLWTAGWTLLRRCREVGLEHTLAESAGLHELSEHTFPGLGSANRPQTVELVGVAVQTACG